MAELSAHLDEARALYDQSAEKRGFGVGISDGIPAAQEGSSAPSSQPNAPREANQGVEIDVTI